MSVVIETSLGELVFDLFTDDCPKTSFNFVKLCKLKYYNNNIFHKVEKNFVAQSGDPTGTGLGGESIYSFIENPPQKYFKDEIHAHIRHNKIGLLCMNSSAPNQNGSAFYITLASNLAYLDDKHTIFGELVEGEETLARLNATYCDVNHRPYQNIRIKHTSVLIDPYPDTNMMLDLYPTESPKIESDQFDIGRLRADDQWEDEFEGKTDDEIRAALRIKESKSRANILVVLGDLPDADIRPPDNVLFVCNLNSITEDNDLAIIFSAFGTVLSCEIIRDTKTGRSLQYAFVEMETAEQAERAYTKMQNTMIDRQKVKVDFSQSVSKLWNTMRRDKKNNLQNTKKNANQQDRNFSSKNRENYREQPTKIDNNNRDYERDRNHKRHNDREYRDSKTYHRNRSRSRSRSVDREERNNSKKNEANSRELNYDRDRRRHGRDRSRYKNDRRRDRNHDRSHRNSDRDRSRDRDRDRDRSRDRAS